MKKFILLLLIMMFLTCGCEKKDAVQETSPPGDQEKKAVTTGYGFYEIKIIATPVHYGTEYLTIRYCLANSAKEAAGGALLWYGGSEIYNPTHTTKVSARLGALYDANNVNHVKYKLKLENERKRSWE